MDEKKVTVLLIICGSADQWMSKLLLFLMRRETRILTDKETERLIELLMGGY